jgi:hypothetical protein
VALGQYNIVLGEVRALFLERPFLEQHFGAATSHCWRAKLLSSLFLLLCFIFKNWARVAFCVLDCFCVAGGGAPLQIKDGPEVPTSLRAVKLLARYLAAPQDKDLVVKTLGEWLTAGQSVN